MNIKCICVLCYKYGSVNHLIIKKLKEDIQKSGNDTDLWLLYNIEDTNERREQYQKYLNQGYNVWTFKFRDIQKKYPLNFFLRQHNIFKPTTDYSYGNLLWPILEFSQNLPYEYYMFYEDDSVYTGNINQLYKEALHENHDIYFLGQFIERNINDSWIWLKSSISHLPQKYLSKNDIIYSKIINLYIISYKNCQIMLNNILKDEWMGMHEYLLPTICKFLNWDIYFLRDKLNYWCQSCYPDDVKYIISDLTKDQLRNSFFHPVKDLDTYNKIV